MAWSKFSLTMCFLWRNCSNIIFGKGASTISTIDVGAYGNQVSSNHQLLVATQGEMAASPTWMGESQHWCSNRWYRVDQSWCCPEGWRGYNNCGLDGSTSKTFKCFCWWGPSYQGRVMPNPKLAIRKVHYRVQCASNGQCYIGPLRSRIKQPTTSETFSRAFKHCLGGNFNTLSGRKSSCI